MKVLKIVFIVVIVLILAGFAGVYLYLKSFDVNKYKPQIEAELTKQLGRKVVLGNLALELSWKRGVSLAVDKMTVEDNKDVFNNEFLMTADKLNFNVDAAQFVSSKRIVVTQIAVEAPSLYIVRNKAGLINWQEVAKNEEPVAAGSPESTPPVAAQSQPGVPVIPDFTINNIGIHNGKFIFTDEGFSSPLQMNMDHLNIEIKNFRLNELFNFELTARLLSNVDNLAVKGQGLVDATTQAVKLQNVSFDTNLANLNVEALNQLLKIFSADYLKDNVEGSVKANIDALEAGAAGLKELKANLNLIDGKLSLKFLQFPVENIDMQLSADSKDILIHQLYFYVASGKVDIKGKVGNYMAQPSLVLNGQADDVKVEEMLPAELSALKVQGKIDAKFDADIAQLLLWEQTAKVEGNITVQDGVIKDFNILKTVLESISFIPNLYENVSANLSPKYKEILAGRDTVIQSLTSQVKLENAVAQFTNHLEAQGFMGDVVGQCDLKMESMVNASLSVAKDLSQSIVVSAAPLSGLLNEKEEIVFPLATYQGPISQYKPFPDLEIIGKKIVKSEGKEELKKVIFDALGIKPAQPQENPQDPNNPQTDNTQPQEQKQEQRPEEIIINNVLDVLFK